MSFYRPDLTTLQQRLIADLQASLPGVDLSQPGSVLAAIAKVQAGGIHGINGFNDAIWPNLFAHLATGEFVEADAGTYGLSRVPAVSANGAVAISGADGSTLPAGSTFQRADGAQYTTQADAIIAAGTASVEVVAVLPGLAGDVAMGTSLTLVQTVAGINSAALANVGGIAGGADAESDDSLRARLLARKRQPPHGGAVHDYVAWAREAGATRAWAINSWLGIGTIGVTFVIDGRDDIIPTVQEVADVQAYIEAHRPVTAQVTVFAPTPKVVDFQIRIDPNSLAVQAEVEAELRDLWANEATLGTRLYISRIRSAIGRTVGLTDYTLIAPVADVIPLAHEIPKIGAIVWSGP
ncbi:MAG: baseplate J/gp47 family protein [Alphaproteobacteria bacterium]|nr:baseplate J/gp47 family protein [Alphaproteobacteria bacterium]